MEPTREWLSQPGGLAARLRAARKDAGLTQDRLAALAGWARSKVPKIENGRQLPSRADLKAWTRACRQPGLLPELLAMLADAEAVYRQWRLGAGGHEVLSGQIGAVVRSSSVIRGFSTMVIPVLLQTPEYARHRALEAVRLHGADPDRVDRVVAARMDWQRALFDPARKCTFVICRAALDYLLCPPEVLDAQRAQLITFSRLPGVTLGVITPGTPLPAAPPADFLMCDETVMTETFTSMITLSAAEAPRYAEITELMLSAAAAGEDARLVIAGAGPGGLRAARPHGTRPT